MFLLSGPTYTFAQRSESRFEIFNVYSAHERNFPFNIMKKTLKFMKESEFSSPTDARSTSNESSPETLRQTNELKLINEIEAGNCGQ